MIDLHCHILPGLDDGSPDLDVSLAMARLAQQDGITDIVATPHLFRGVSQLTDLSLVAKKQKELQAALDREKIPLRVHCGVEIRFSHNLLDEIKKHRPNLVLAGSSYMFIEFPFEYVYSGVKDVFFQAMSEGVVPIITHPERCSGFMNHPEILFELVEMGALAQMNAGSITGRYGSQIKETALLFLGLNCVHFLASDAHDTKSRPPILSGARKLAEAAIGEEAARSLVEDNPRAVLEDKPLPYQPEPIAPEEPEKHLHLRIPSFLRSKKAE
jgi:protein-tyrosine phosphatase